MTLEDRVRRLEDIAAITQLIASYGPLVDAGAAEQVASLFTPDGVYDVTPAPLEGREAIEQMVAGPHHQALIEAGVAHLQGLPSITVQGDVATAVNHSVVLRGRDVWRVAANRWELVRTDEGWRVQHRVNRLLDGSAEARGLLSDR